MLRICSDYPSVRDTLLACLTRAVPPFSLSCAAIAPARLPPSPVNFVPKNAENHNERGSASSPPKPSVPMSWWPSSWGSALCSTRRKSESRGTAGTTLRYDIERTTHVLYWVGTLKRHQHVLIVTVSTNTLCARFGHWAPSVPDGSAVEVTI